jgi:hypothetical protein
MTKPLMIGIGVVVVLALAGGVYAVTKKKSRILSNTAINSSCKYDDPDLCKFINAWKENKYYTVTSETTKNGQQSTSVFKTTNDNKSEVKITTDGKETYNIITIGDTTYIKDYADGKWTKYTSEPNETVEQFESDLSFDEKANQLEDKTTYKKISTEACGKLTCYKYQVINPGAPDTTEFIYFDTKEYQLQKTRIENKDGSANETTFDYSTFTINEPSPIKEAASSAPSTQDTDDLKREAEKAFQNLNTPSQMPEYTNDDGYFAE